MAQIDTENIIKEMELPSKTLALIDKIRVIGSDSESYAVLLSALAQAVVSAYEGTSLAGKAQSVKAAVDDLAEDIATEADERSQAVTTINTAMQTLSKKDMLLCDEVPDTRQTYTFNESGSISSVTHKSGNTAVRTDAFAYGENTVTETRTLENGASLVIETNLSTLETTVTYSEE